MGLSSLRFLTVVRLTCARERSTIEPLASRIVDRISVNPNVHFGKPCVAGTRITVENVLELVSEGLSFEEMIRDYYPGAHGPRYSSLRALCHERWNRSNLKRP